MILRARAPSCTGFTLLEVLLAFAILISALTLISAGFGRQIAALQALEGSVDAHHAAEGGMIRELIRRETGSEPAEEGAPVVVAPFTVSPLTLKTEPFKDVTVDLGSARVFWTSRGQTRFAALVVAFPQPQNAGESGGKTN